ncbi:ABC transporter ATP-binding protein [Microbulbifer epialgicus]|uniref:ABC transporter ATP-binding protein n=1 Tax=Microbulbifer epialgicus TaxID=393907 RepID=A0ABV4P399_9GAMM
MLLKLKKIYKEYRTEEILTTSLNNICVNIQAGEFVAICGPSGSGKSTLLNVMGLLDEPTKGSYEFDGKEVTTCSEREISYIRKLNVGFIFQDFNLLSDMSVEKNVELALLYHNVSKSMRKKRVDEILERMEISHRAKHKASQLSGGQQQRVAIARALVSKPKIIFADEPTGNLDSLRSAEVLNLLRELNSFGSTVIMVTHSEDQAKSCERIITMLDGKIISDSKKNTITPKNIEGVTVHD